MLGTCMHQLHVPISSLQRPSRISNVTRCPLPTRPQLKQWRCSASVPVVETIPKYETQEEVKKGLMKLGWGRSWVDGITERIGKGELKTNTENYQAVINYLESLGIPSQSVCNMCAVVPTLLGMKVSELEPVVKHLKETAGATGEVLVKLLVLHPKLLTYTVSADGKRLEKGKARAEVDVVTVKGGKEAAVSYYREGVVFDKSPVAPFKPARV